MALPRNLRKGDLRGSRTELQMSFCLKRFRHRFRFEMVLSSRTSNLSRVRSNNADYAIFPEISTLRTSRKMDEFSIDMLEKLRSSAGGDEGRTRDVHGYVNERCETCETCVFVGLGEHVLRKTKQLPY